MQVQNIMTRAVVSVHMDDSLQQINDIFNKSKFHHLIVKDGDHIVGVISDRDLLKHISPFIDSPTMERRQDTNTLSKRAHQIMSRKPITVGESMPVTAAIEVLLNSGVSCLPVTGQDRRVTGIVTWRDLLRHINVQDDDSAQAA